MPSGADSHAFPGGYDEALVKNALHGAPNVALARPW
jgi:hypothetical protein